jgi:hypothetical protein
LEALMAYRNDTYIAFHAEGNPDPTGSDIKYFNIMKAWHHNDDIDFTFVNSHDKVSSVRDTSKRDTLARSLKERLNNSKNMVLIIGDRTRFDTDWVPFEIDYGTGTCGLPVIAVYPGYLYITDPSELSHLWPKAFAERVSAGSVRAIHVPFQQKAIDAAIRKYNINDQPNSSLEYWTAQTQRNFGIDVPAILG